MGSSKIITNKRDAHIEAHFLRTAKKILEASFRWGREGAKGGLCVGLNKLKKNFTHKRAAH